MILQAGMQISNSINPLTDLAGNIALGTIGGIVYLERKPVLLTCFHCVYSSDMVTWNFVPGSSPDRVQTVIDGAFQECGTILKALLTPTVDAAIIEPLPGFDLVAAIDTIGEILDKRILTDAEKNNMVGQQKFGAVTDHRDGVYKGISPSSIVEYYPNIQHQFTALIKVQGIGDTFSEAGDSGSLILDRNNLVTGMVVMGDGTISYGAMSNEIEKALGITFKKPSP